MRVQAIVSSAITTAVPFDLECVIARGFTASDTGGTALTPLGTSNKLRTSMGNSLMTDLRVATTAALGVGTRTPDANAIGRIQGNTGTALATNPFGGTPPYLVDRLSAPGIMPVVLALNEGIIVRNPLAGPATGTITLLFDIEWSEVAAY